jgi:hypothetical protein
MSNQTTVAGMFKRAQEIKHSNSDLSYLEIKDRLVSEFSGGAFPSSHSLTIPEQDKRAPEEDWTAGLPITLRGIQNQDWNEVAHGLVICLEQVENYEREYGRDDSPEKEWHDRSKGIAESEEKNLSKWMPEELLNLAQSAAKK